MASATEIKQLSAIASAAMRNEAYPAGHFYSPIPDFDWLAENADRALVYEADSLPGIDLNEIEQLAMVERLARFLPLYDWPEERQPNRRYFSGNPVFGRGSAVMLFLMMMELKPRWIVEVGSGFSSAVMLDTAERSDYRALTQLIFIEPHPQRLRELLRADDDSRCEIIEKPVQEVSLSLFESLGANDILFIELVACRSRRQ